MKISKVKLINDGLKGIEVTYALSVNRNNLDYIVPHVVRFPFPIHSELREAFLVLDKHFKKIMGLKDTAEIKINGIVGGEITMMLLAKLTVLHEYTSAVNTPLLDEDCGYTAWDVLLTDIQAVYDHVHDYVMKGKEAEPKQYVMELFDSRQEKMKKRFPKDITREEVEKLDADQAYVMMKQILEDRGCLVTAPEDLQDGSEVSDVVPTEEEIFK